MQQILLQLQSKCDALQEEILAEVPQFSIQDGEMLRDGQTLIGLDPQVPWQVRSFNDECHLNFNGTIALTILCLDRARFRWTIYYESHTMQGQIGKFGLHALLASLGALETG